MHVTTEISTFPKNIIISPTPATIIYRIPLEKTISKPSLAAIQKFFPVIAI